MEFDRMGVEEIKQSIREKLENNFGCGLSDATPQQLYQAVARTVRDEVMRRRTASRGVRKTERKKKVYYLCAEFLTGRALHSNIVNLVNEDNYAQALKELGINEDAIFELEPEPGLGNGGLGRLAACFLDALTTMELPAMGCTIRYEFGLFRQKLIDGYQAEVPDNWLESGNIWEIPRPDETVEVHFGGRLEEYTENGRLKYRHLDYKTVEAVPYDIPVVGYDSCMVNMLRVWSARSKKQIDMASFNSGQYIRAMEERELAEVISKVLYPNDNNYEGKELRLKQQYFFSSASIQYAVNDFIKVYGYNWRIFPDKVAIHINDTHPAIAIPELMRILVDEYELDWDFAQDICYRTFAYTNHTVMQEALERWPEDMFRVQLPRIYMILNEMNRRLCQDLWDAFPGQWDRIAHMSILAYGQVQMANLAVAYSHSVNGVSAIHTDILRKQTFRDYAMLQPRKFVSITNGITHRRWLRQANPGLSKLLDEAIGTAWRRDPEAVEGRPRMARAHGARLFRPHALPRTRPPARGAGARHLPAPGRGRVHLRGGAAGGRRQFVVLLHPRIRRWRRAARRGERFRAGGREFARAPRFAAVLRRRARPLLRRGRGVRLRAAELPDHRVRPRGRGPGVDARGDDDADHGRSLPSRGRKGPKGPRAVVLLPR